MWQFVNGRHQPLYSVETADHCSVWHCVCFRHVTTQTHFYTHTHIHTHSTLNDVCSEVVSTSSLWKNVCFLLLNVCILYAFFSINECLCGGCMHACLHAIKFMQKHVCGHGNYLCTFVHIKYKAFMEKQECQGERWEQERMCTYLSVLILCFHIHSSWNQHMY
jgi:hypothetical protein